MNPNDRCVLLVEDDPDDQFFINRILHKAGIDRPTVTMNNGQSAIDYLSAAIAAERPDLLPFLIVTDLKMPLVNGIELCRWVRSKEALREVPLIVMSSSSLQRDIDAAMEAGATSFRQKFPQAGEVASLVEAHCGKRS